ncbi:GntR family transcriptional regulator [Aureimonas glaciei]|jgi:DNA-binding GntR family transcriptional regulator|uniref:GntR family transcriptional regulator n=1 Tax=Aureimonas glaciei TaxID=1776957 RepID=A0A916XTW4_9HYPH|nr:GntR family transcriptional regulator [Aureimonas glaciei]GGD07362.1 GntR family transcriptional regulator [Aureimonas glaciei]
MSLEWALQDVVAAPRSTIADTVFDELRRAILELRLQPGTKISEAEIAKRLGVSRQPVREAFARLARAGYLRIQPQKATEIMKISTREVLNARFIREAVEVATVRRACEIGDAVMLDRLGEILALQEKAQRVDDREEFHRQDDAFHLGIAEGADCRFAWTLIDEQKAQMDRVRFLSLAFGQSAAFDDHLRIFAGLEARDADAAEAAMRQHLSRITDILARLRGDFDRFFQDGAA